MNALKSFLFVIPATILIFNCICYSNQDLDEKLLEATISGDTKLVGQLIQKGADVNCTIEIQSLKYTPIAIATSSGNIDMVKFLLKSGSKPEGSIEFPNLAFYLSITRNYPVIADELIKAGVDPNFAWDDENGGTLLTNAAQFDNIEIVDLLVRNGADVNYTGSGKYSALYRSIIYDHPTVMMHLLKNGAKLNQNDKLALDSFGFFENKEFENTVQILSNKGALN